MSANQKSHKHATDLSFYNYLKSEIHRGYLLENDEERYAARREKVYTFLKIPRELEKFLACGFFQCLDAFLFVLAFLPIRFILAVFLLLTRFIKQIVRFNRRADRLMKPAEIVDLLKGLVLIICCYFISYLDTSACYHIIKTQSTIKLYLFFNMLEIADRLMSAFGQDTLDALFWTATEPRDRKREHFGIIFHLMVACIYVAVHSLINLLQALCLNVAINSDNKGLLTIVISNNFIELKGAVFKKFDRNNLLQISCSDVKERFHLGVMLFGVVIQTMKEYSWKEERLWILLPDCFFVLGIEVMIDWLKHAFITRFNNIPVDAYRDFTLLISSDLVLCKRKYAYSDHSDLIARRMGFITLPLGVVIFKILTQSLKIRNVYGILIFIFAFLAVLTFRIFCGIVILGIASQLISDQEKLQKSSESSQEKPSFTTPGRSYSPMKVCDSSLFKPCISGNNFRSISPAKFSDNFTPQNRSFSPALNFDFPSNSSTNSNTIMRWEAMAKVAANDSAPKTPDLSTKNSDSVQVNDKNHSLPPKTSDSTVLSATANKLLIRNNSASSSRSRNPSQSISTSLSISTDSIFHKEIQSVIENELSKSNLDKRNSQSSDLNEPQIQDIDNHDLSTSIISIKSTESAMEPLEFSDESGKGLMANSMINLASSGLNRGSNINYKDSEENVCNEKDINYISQENAPTLLANDSEPTINVIANGECDSEQNEREVPDIMNASTQSCPSLDFYRENNSQISPSLDNFDGECDPDSDDSLMDQTVVERNVWDSKDKDQ